MAKIPLDSYDSFTAHLEDREYFGQKLGLDRIRSILLRLGRPENKFKSIHIAGTNGKGSTATMIASILRESGYKVGLFTSPHLIDFCERVRVGSEEISQEKVLHWARAIREVEEEPLTFFEMATAIAFLHFAEEQVSWAVVEVGMGGRLDATNVITPNLSIITSVGFDHKQHLGDTLGKITFEKGGIIKSFTPVITGPLLPEAASVIHEIAIKKGARQILPTEELVIPALPVSGDHQAENARVAATAIQFLAQERQISLKPHSVERGFASVNLPGRLQTVQKDPWIIIDGAHNPPAMKAVVKFLEERLEGRRLKVLFGAMKDKDHGEVLSKISPITDEFFFVPLALERSAKVDDLSRIAKGLNKKFVPFESLEAGIKSVSKNLTKEDVLLVTGSLFMSSSLSIF